jgi:hypothetical protein
MLDSSLVKNNPQLLVFVPLFYTVWSDSILTPSEVSTLEGLLTSQQWLTETERKFLLTKIDPKQPPSVEEFNSWKAAIAEVANNSQSGDTLVNLGIRLAALQGNGTITQTLEKVRPSLLQKLRQHLVSLATKLFLIFWVVVKPLHQNSPHNKILT